MPFDKSKKIIQISQESQSYLNSIKKNYNIGSYENAIELLTQRNSLFIGNFITGKNEWFICWGRDSVKAMRYVEENSGKKVNKIHELLNSSGVVSFKILKLKATLDGKEFTHIKKTGFDDGLVFFEDQYVEDFITQILSTSTKDTVGDIIAFTPEEYDEIWESVLECPSCHKKPFHPVKGCKYCGTKP